jgi:hypothetical protein
VGTVKIALQADTAGSPSGSDLASITLTNTEYNVLPVGEFTALFSSEYASLVVGELYWIVVTPSTSDNSNHPNLGTNTAGGYASGTLKYKNVTDSWVLITTTDLYFKTLEGLNSQIPKTNSSGKIPTDFIDTTNQNYVLGALENAFVKAYLNIQLLFIQAQGLTTGATETGQQGWLKTSAAVTVAYGGAMAKFDSTGNDSLALLEFAFRTNSLPLEWDDTHKVIMDWWAYLPESSTGDINMGFFDGVAGMIDAYNDSTEDRVVFSQTAAGVLHATISKAGVGVTNTDIDLGFTSTRWNNFRIELDLSNNALFYVNGVLNATLSGANLPSTGGDIALGFGRSDTADFAVTAPNISLEMNP